MHPASGIASILRRLRTLLRTLRTANRANVTVTFALATVPIVGFVGAAVDYSHANSVKTAMQAAVDSTALMLSKQAATLTQSDVQTKADAYFKALFNRPEASGVLVTSTYTTDGGSKMVIAATANVKANFMGLMGVTEMKMRAESTSKWGNTKLRVALALDTTGSMSDDGKIDALKTATKSLLTQLKAAASKDGDVYVSIIPFSKDVNFGKSSYQETWIRWDLWERPEVIAASRRGGAPTTPKRIARTLEANGPPTATASGMAASPTATRITTPRTPRRTPTCRRRCFQPSSTARARPSFCR
jgi:Flp pilus assembly protein TadG